MKNAEYCYKCEARLDYPGVTFPPGVKVLGECEKCKDPITLQNPKFTCQACGTEFCLACEEKFRQSRERGEKPFCIECFPQYQELIKKLSMGTRVPK